VCVCVCVSTLACVYECALSRHALGCCRRRGRGMKREIEGIGQALLAAAVLEECGLWNSSAGQMRLGSPNP